MKNLDVKTIMQAIRIFRLWIFDYVSSLFTLWIIFQFHFTLELCYLWLTLYDETSTMYVILEFEIKYDIYFFARCIEWCL